MSESRVQSICAAGDACLEDDHNIYFLGGLNWSKSKQVLIVGPDGTRSFGQFHLDCEPEQQPEGTSP